MRLPRSSTVNGCALLVWPATMTVTGAEPALLPSGAAVVMAVSVQREDRRRHAAKRDGRAALARTEVRARQDDPRSGQPRRRRDAGRRRRGRDGILAATDAPEGEDRSRTGGERVRDAAAVPGRHRELDGRRRRVVHRHPLRPVRGVERAGLEARHAIGSGCPGRSARGEHVDLADRPPVSRALRGDDPNVARRHRLEHDAQQLAAARAAGDRRSPVDPVVRDVHLVATREVAGADRRVDEQAVKGPRGAEVEAEPVPVRLPMAAAPARPGVAVQDVGGRVATRR